MQEENVRRKSAKKRGLETDGKLQSKDDRAKRKKQEWWNKPSADAQPWQADDDAAYYREEASYARMHMSMSSLHTYG